MLTPLKANIRTNLKYFSRNRILHVVSFLFLGLMLLMAIPSFFYMSGDKMFRLVSTLFIQIQWYTRTLAGAMVLFYMFHHLTSRNMKMVFTKPCKPEIWLGSVLTTPILVALALNTFALLMVLVTCVLAKIPFQMGFVFITVTSWLKTINVVCYITFLTLIIHPILTLVFILVFREGFFYWFYQVAFYNYERASTAISKFLLFATHVLYLIIPISDPFQDNLLYVQHSMRVENHHWVYLFQSAGYTAALVGFLFFASTLILYKKQLS